MSQSDQDPGLDERHPRLVLPAAAGRPGRPVPARGPYFTRIGIPVPARVARRRLQHFVPALRRADVLEALSAEPVSYFFAVPTMVADLTRMAGGQRLDLPALKAVMVSGAPNSERTALAGHEVFGDTMYQMYGLPRPSRSRSWAPLPPFFRHTRRRARPLPL